MHTTQSRCPRASEVGRRLAAHPPDPDLAAHLAACPDCRAAADALDPPTASPVPTVTGPGPSDIATRPTATPHPVPADACPDPTPRELGPYELLEPLGEGGMGRVFKARHRLLQRVDAVKCIHPEFARDPRLVGRFLQEVRAAARLHHPNVVSVYAADRADGVYYLAMEYVPGSDLRRAARGGQPLPVGVACGYVRQAAVGLQHAHERGLVHRDIKPGNLLLAADGTVKIADFGLARLMPLGQSTEADGTATGALLGTVGYMAPEQADDASRADIRADLYSLGCTLFELLTGQVPFPGGTLGGRLRRHATDPPPPLESVRPDAPPPLAAVVARLLAKRPEDRFQTPAEFVAALDLAFATPPAPPPHVEPRARGLLRGPGVVLASAAVVVVTGAGIATLLTRGGGPPFTGSGPAATAPAVTVPAAAVATRTPPRPAAPPLGAEFRSEAPADEVSVAVTPAGGVAVALNTGVVEIWDDGNPARKPRRVVLTGAAERWNRLILSPDADWVVGGCLGAWRLARGADRVTPTLFAREDRAVLGDGVIGEMDDAVFLPGGKAVLAAVTLSQRSEKWPGDSVLVVWETATGRLLRAAAPPVTMSVKTVAVSADGKRFACAAEDGKVLAGDTADLAARTLAADALQVKGAPYKVALDSAGTTVFAVSGEAGDVVAWDLTSGAEKHRFRTRSAVWSLAVSPDDRRLVAGGYILTVWSLTADPPAESAVLMDFTTGQQVYAIAFWGPGAVLVGYHAGADDPGLAVRPVR